MSKFSALLPGDISEGLFFIFYKDHILNSDFPKLKFIGFFSPSFILTFLLFFPLDSFSSILVAISILVGFSVNMIFIMTSNIEKDKKGTQFSIVLEETLSFILHSISVGVVLIFLISLSTLPIQPVDVPYVSLKNIYSVLPKDTLIFLIRTSLNFILIYYAMTILYIIRKTIALVRDEYITQIKTE